MTVLRPETLGRLARRKQGAERCELSFNFDNKSLDTSFVFSTRSKSEVQMEKAPEQWLVKPLSLFLHVSCLLYALGSFPI